MLTLIGRGAATDPLVSLLCPPHHTLLMAPGQKLNEIVAEWRRRKIVAMAAGKQAPPLVLFPAVSEGGGMEGRGRRGREAADGGGARCACI